MYKTTVDQLHKGMLDEMDGSYQKTIGYPTHDLLRAVAICVAPFGEKLDEVAAKLDVNNLSGGELKRFVEQHSSVRHREATKAEAILTVTGNGVVNTGDLFETKGGVQFEATETVTIVESGDVRVVAVLTGPSGNVGASAITLIPKTLPGIIVCTNSAPAAGGYRAETDGSLRERYYEALRTPATSGNASHYKMWAKSVPGVGDAKVFPLWKGDNTVQVVIVNDQKTPADATLVKKVQDYIDPNSSGTGEGEAPIGAYCTVTAATAVTINVAVKLILGDAVNNVDITPYIVKYLQEIAFKQNYCSIGRVGDAALDAPGVIDYENLTLNGGTANITIPDKSVAVLGTVTIHE